MERKEKEESPEEGVIQFPNHSELIELCSNQGLTKNSIFSLPFREAALKFCSARAVVSDYLYNYDCLAGDLLGPYPLV